jgi:hypothetical protein
MRTFTCFIPLFTTVLVGIALLNLLAGNGLMCFFCAAVAATLHLDEDHEDAIDAL